MPVSFYALATIIISSFLLTLLPFAGFPYSWDKALTAVLGSLIFGVSIFSLYQAYTRIVTKMEQRERVGRKSKREEKSKTLEVESEEE